MVNARDSDLYDRFVTHKVDANSLCPDDMADIIRDTVMPAAPPGMLQVHLGGGSSGAEANELAVAAAFRKVSKDHNIAVNKLVAIGFDNSHAGNTTGTLSFSAADANPNGLPAFPWPKA